MEKIKAVCYLLASWLCINTTNAQHTLIVKVNEPKADIQPTMWGIFFEDINLGADGGIYAELVKNRSFEFIKPMMGWTIQQSKKADPQIAAMNPPVLVINKKDANTANPRYIRVTVNDAAKGDIGLTNEGFRGMGIKKDLRYDFSVMYHQDAPGIKMHIELVDSNNNVLGGTTVTPYEAGIVWHKIAASFTANATVMKAKMNIWFEGNGVIDLDMISLFPSDTWKNRPGGMRADMIQKLADLHPGFIRFPGGCIVEGYDLEHRYQWKKTLGPIEERQLIINRWNTEFANRPAPDYFQTFGLGFFEYFQLAEDIGAEPLPILNCGMACQFNSAEVTTIDELDPYVQDALDLVEFANGDVSTKWGKVRADMGHPAPFNLKMMGIGNENWGPQYVERLKIFTKAIKAKYPNFKLINSSGFAPDGSLFNYLNDTLRAMHADFIDEHYYRSPEWFFSNVKRYDTFPRNETKIFAGEYASHVNGTNAEQKNCWLSALSEAAFMTGLERNADVVSMASYAPLFAHIDGWQWTPDLIWVNNLQSYGTPDYYVQQMYSLNKGTKVIPVTMDNNAVTGQDSLFATAAIDATTNEVIIKLVNASNKSQKNTISLQGIKKLAAEGKSVVLKSNDLYSVNSFSEPTKISPHESAITIKGKSIALDAAPYSFNIIRVKML
ncbi:alpha-L-arabinofuranosidase [Panacibacter ginsenosidivorans]|uniref:non-reducing end alpha-L-arabinofuranosidase n=1 Tax=Panacibacter ginsenosidivorans TaxID=1813871 RepID=A0A5B8VCG8_9BACT|nr:alpha-L-arabinofuranosidase C-terminal domain-containing protein [Panacibacter ginsenosidivorans]QEC67988.1 alpha-L-arabinofuranosidase [Panacibacter ginsenosidivorans]